MVEAEKGKTVFLKDEDIRDLLMRKKVKATIKGNGEEITLVYLQGNLIDEKDVTSAGKPGYYHVPVGTLGDSYSTAFVVPADVKSEAPASTEGGKKSEKKSR